MKLDDAGTRRPGFDRRKFLARAAIASGTAYVAPVITTFGLSRASATPCAGIASAPVPEATVDAIAQEDARSARTHSPCYQRCMEQRANREHEAHLAFFACVEEAAGNDGAITGCAQQYRAKLASFVNEFRTCQKRCT